MKDFYIEATGVRAIRSKDERTGKIVERLGEMNFESYQVSMTIVKDAKSLYDKLRDPEFKKFYEADSGKKNELLSFDDWKVLALLVDQTAADEELKKIFDKAKNREINDKAESQFNDVAPRGKLSLEVWNKMHEGSKYEIDKQEFPFDKVDKDGNGYLEDIKRVIRGC